MDLLLAGRGQTWEAFLESSWIYLVCKSKAST